MRLGLAEAPLTARDLVFFMCWEAHAPQSAPLTRDRVLPRRPENRGRPINFTCPTRQWNALGQDPGIVPTCCAGHCALPFLADRTSSSQSEHHDQRPVDFHLRCSVQLSDSLPHLLARHSH
jgi:hypothetical protein